MSDVPHHPFLECSHRIPLVVRPGISARGHAPHQDGLHEKQQGQKHICENRHAGQKREHAEANDQEQDEDKVEKDHGNKIVPTVEKRFLKKKTFHIQDSKRKKGQIQSVMTK